MVTVVPTNETAWYLIGYVADQDSARYIPLNVTPFQVGRRSDLDLCLSSRSVSKLHAELLVLGDGLFVRDLQSTNGTYLNGRRLTADAPLNEGDVVQFADVEFRIGRQKEGDCERTIENEDFAELAGIAKFDELIRCEAVVPHFQPIVTMDAARTVIGYEALARTSVAGLENPRELFQTAARLRHEAELSELCRKKAVEFGTKLPGDPLLFLNTHPAEALHEGVVASLDAVRTVRPDQKIVVEIHEAAVTDLDQMQSFRDVLREQNIKLAYDDFGAGQSRLLDLAKVPPDYLKFDRGLVHDIHKASPQQQQMVKMLVQMVRGFGIAALAEGIETAEDADVCREIGFELAQGFYFGRPAPVETWASR